MRSLRDLFLDIKAFIRELLFSHDCVIVPGFGGFIGNFTPARLDNKTGLYYPPLKQISFNRNLNHNDGLLIGRISMATGLNYADSRRLVEEFSNDIMEKLSSGRQVVFDHIGTFVNNHENNVEFEPEAGINYHTGSFGLEPFHWNPPREYDVRKRVTGRFSRETIKQNSARRNLWRAAVLIPVLALLIAVPFRSELTRQGVETTSLNPLVTAEFENNRMAIEKEIKAEPAAEIYQADAALPEPAAESSAVDEAGTVPVSGIRYSVITGSFKSEENALTHIKELKADGYEPEMQLAPNGFFRVKAMICSSKEQAVRTRDSISGKFPGAWVSTGR